MSALPDEINGMSARGLQKGRMRPRSLEDMPFDVLFKVFPRLDITSLVALSRASKNLHQLLLSSDAFIVTCWNNAFEDALSKGQSYVKPDEVPLMSWIQIVHGGLYCHSCGKKCYRRISFAVRARFCFDCMQKNMIRVPRTTVSNEAPVDMIMPVIPVNGIIRTPDEYWVLPHKLRAAKAAICEAKKRGSDPNARTRAVRSTVDSMYRTYKDRWVHAQWCEGYQDYLQALRTKQVLGRGQQKRETKTKRQTSRSSHASSDIDVPDMIMWIIGR